jgi:hypothetical protein
MRITQKLIWERIEWYEQEYGFTSKDGWNQIRKDLNPPPAVSIELPRAVAYGAYMELLYLAGM